MQKYTQPCWADQEHNLWRGRGVHMKPCTSSLTDTVWPPIWWWTDHRNKQLGRFRRSVRRRISILSRRGHTNHGKFRMKGISESWIRALKERWFRESAPKRVWHDALEFETYVRSNIALYIYMLHWGFLETVMLGGTSYINKSLEHGIYYWVMFRDQPI